MLNEETYMPSNKISIPIILLILIIVIYLAMGSFIFHHWEDWDWASSAYFCFITLSTVTSRSQITFKFWPDWIRRFGPNQKFPWLQREHLWKVPDACLHHLLCLGPCPPGHVYVSHPGHSPSSTSRQATLQEGIAIKAEKVKNGISRGVKTVQIDTFEVKTKKDNHYSNLIKGQKWTC